MAAGLLIVLAGNVGPASLAATGDYDVLFRAGLDLSAERAPVVQAHRDEALPDPTRFAGVVVSGSIAMVTEGRAWMQRLGRWMQTCHEAGVPLLGVCFAHQLLALMRGGRVADNPRGPEYGSYTLATTAAAGADPLFAGLPSRPLVHEQHVQAVVDLPPGAVVLAATARDPCNAVRYGPGLWGVQFHPESLPVNVHNAIDAMHAILTADGQDPAACRATIAASPVGPALLRRFRRTICGLAD
ncbi:MAG: glutamine amidotransferase [Planctomycetota bacterium]